MPPASPSTTPSRSTTAAAASSTSLLPSAAVLVPLLLLLWKAGPLNGVLVVLTSVTLLLSPWVRLLLSLPLNDASSAAAAAPLKAWDPARFIAPLGPGPPPPAPAESPESKGGKVRPRAKRPARMADSLRRPLDELTELVVRDFVCSWYDGQSMAHPSFPRTAHFTIDEIVDSVHARVSAGTRSVDIASELLHASTSVLHAALRARRQAPSSLYSPVSPAARSPGLWPSAAARVEALRAAVGVLLDRHLPREEKSSALVRDLLREVATRRLWDLVGACGEPDFINRKIVELADKNGAASPDLPHAGSAPVLQVDPKLLGQARAEAGLLDAAAVAPELPAAKTPEPSHSGTSTPATGLTTQQPRAQHMPLPSPSLSPAPGAGVRTTQQPRAMAMPSPSVRGFVEAELAAASPASISRGPTPLSADGTARRSAEVRRSGERTRDELSAQMAGISAQPPAVPTMGPPALPRRKAAETQDSAGDVMPMDLPAGLAQPDLPEALRRSLKEPQQSPRTSKEEARPTLDGEVMAYQIREKPPALPPRTMSPAAAAPPRSSISDARPPGTPVPRAPPLAHVLTRSDSDRLSRLRDAFEAWLERGGSSRVGRGEGEALLRLHIGLATIARLVPADGENGEMFRPDAASILSKALDALSTAHATGDVPEALEGAVRRLELDAQQGGVREVLGPVERALWARLTSLYSAFWQESHEGARPVRQDSAPVPLAYEPRRKSNAVESSTRTASPGPSARTSFEAQPVRASTDGMPRSSTSSSIASAPASGGVEVTITDVSPNAERPNAPVDSRTLELMIAVEGLASEGGGFVLVRRWSEFEQLDKALRRTLAVSTDSAMDASAAAGAAEAFGLLDGPGRLPPPPVPLPAARMSTSSGISVEAERYLVALLSSPAHATSAPVRKFIDKTRAGAPAGARSNALINSMALGRGIGQGARTFASGVGGLGKTAINSLQIQAPSAGNGGVKKAAAAVPDMAASLASLPAAAVAGVAEAVAPSRSQALEQPPLQHALSEDEAAAELRAMTAKTRAAQDDGTSPPPAAELSQRDLDALLSAVFTVADEAFNLSGGWTLRRGMLRVLEQVVRANYANSILSAFNSTASALSSEQLGHWVTDAQHKWWPDGVFAGGQPGEERTPEMRAHTARRARDIVIGYAPAQAGYVLGPGGRQACEKALALVHEELNNPITALDLGLTLTLRMLDIAVR